MTSRDALQARPRRSPRRRGASPPAEGRARALAIGIAVVVWLAAYGTIMLVGRLFGGPSGA